jgi:hypothetical protein
MVLTLKYSFRNMVCITFEHTVLRRVMEQVILNSKKKIEYQKFIIGAGKNIKNIGELCTCRMFITI